ncbi:hypothetical protein E2C01_041884 [Portunus trituberculatus]|uniref:Uncharacterized protein n=1 Tax=Portunus trituberculatus TaxID=210409 RepID=A0A5B7FT25_PORTR|nr:hypothetical protein [Portunus trituberculatus]
MFGGWPGGRPITVPGAVSAPRPRGDKTLDMLHERITDLPPRQRWPAGHSAALQRGEAVSPGTHPRERRGSMARHSPRSGGRGSVTRQPPGRLLELLLLLHQEHEVPHVDPLDPRPQRHLSAPGTVSHYHHYHQRHPYERTHTRTHTHTHTIHLYNTSPTPTATHRTTPSHDTAVGTAREVGEGDREAQGAAGPRHLRHIQQPWGLREH